MMNNWVQSLQGRTSADIWQDRCYFITALIAAVSLFGTAHLFKTGLRIIFILLSKIYILLRKDTFIMFVSKPACNFLRTILLLQKTLTLLSELKGCEQRFTSAEWQSAESSRGFRSLVLMKLSVLITLVKASCSMLLWAWRSASVHLVRPSWSESTIHTTCLRSTTTFYFCPCHESAHFEL